MSTLSNLYPNLANIISVTNTPREGSVYNPVRIGSMLKAKTIDELIPAYNSVLKKLLIYNYLKEEEIPEKWFVQNTPAQTELRTLLNELIVRIFNGTEYSDQLATKCFVNLRRAPNFRNSVTHILSKSSYEVGRNQDQILKNMRIVYDVYESSVSFSADEDYSNFHKSLDFLLDIGFIKSLKEDAFLKYTIATENVKKELRTSKLDTKAIIIGTILLIVVVFAIIKIVTSSPILSGFFLLARIFAFFFLIGALIFSL